jgi:N-acetylmuramic acid 6-phosphate etherase
MQPPKIFNEITSLRTEQRNPRSQEIDMLTTHQILELINDEDHVVPVAVSEVLPEIEIAVEAIVNAFSLNGRLFYIGAGTSGRLGILDASECPPTFGTTPEMIQGIIAGGNQAVFQSLEGAEDNFDSGVNVIIERNINPPDIVCGIAASGRTPYVRGALSEARKRCIYSILVSTSDKENIRNLGIEADVMICPNVGPEVIAGSTRMKSGTAQKLILNMLTTASMIRLGKTLGNVMVDLQLKSAKLAERAKKILMSLTNVSYQEAELTLSESDGNVKTALVMILAGVSAIQARERLNEANGFVRKALINPF